MNEPDGDIDCKVEIVLRSMELRKRAASGIHIHVLHSKGSEYIRIRTCMDVMAYLQVFLPLRLPQFRHDGCTL